MAPFQKIAKHLVAEVPVAKLQGLLKDPGSQIADVSGGVCGGGCDGRNGVFCGFNCRAVASAPGVVDRDGQLKLSVKDLKDVRDDLPKLRQAVARQINTHLGRLR
jgi:hypothetical protein